MIDNFKADLIIHAAKFPPTEILERMGYKKPTEKNLERLERVLLSPDFALGSGGFDLKYTSEGFLTALCVAVGLEESESQQRIQAVLRHLQDEENAFKPFIWMDTGFKRKNQPLFALAACENQRYLHFPDGFWRLSLEEQLDAAQSLVRKHVFDSDGMLGIWGEIKQYWFYYKKDAAYLLAKNGERVGVHHGPVPSQSGPGRKLAVITGEQKAR